MGWKKVDLYKYHSIISANDQGFNMQRFIDRIGQYIEANERRNEEINLLGIAWLGGVGILIGVICIAAIFFAKSVGLIDDISPAWAISLWFFMTGSPLFFGGIILHFWFKAVAVRKWWALELAKRAMVIIGSFMIIHLFVDYLNIRYKWAELITDGIILFIFVMASSKSQNILDKLIISLFSSENDHITRNYPSGSFKTKEELSDEHSKKRLYAVIMFFATTIAIIVMIGWAIVYNFILPQN